MLPKNCIQCEHHKVIADPDPHDWFCDDDSAVICTQVLNPDKDLNSKYAADRSNYRSVTTSCRPYNLEKETTPPSWCPIRKKKK